MDVSTPDALCMLRWMVLTRLFEDKTVELHKQRGIPETPHCSNGQEAVGVGVCYSLRPDDFVLPSLRTRAAFMVRGVPVAVQLAAMFGKDTPQCGGKTTSHHMGDVARNLLACTGIVGGHIAPAVGVALAINYRRTDAISVVFFGDGACNRGDFHEALNLASVLGLPVLFVIENNQYAISTPVSKSFKGTRLCDRAAAYGFPGIQVDGMDVIAVHTAAREAIATIRRQSVPTLLECVTYRFRGHNENDVEQPYRTREEVEQWVLRDPIKRLRSELLLRGVPQRDLDAIEESCRVEVNDAVAYMDAAPLPATETTTTFTYVRRSAETVM